MELNPSQELISPQEMEALSRSVREGLIAQREKPLTIAIMGQTGVGKSTLIRSLFNITNDREVVYPTVGNAVRPVTKEVLTYNLSGAKGLPIRVHDMPGIGESEELDRTTLIEYREYFLRSDVVIWAFHVDNRSTTFDVQAIREMLIDIPAEQRNILMSKLTFVLTKADVLVPVPWIIGYTGSYAVLVPGRQTQEILEEKERYYQEKFIAPFGENITSSTYNDAHFDLKDPFSYNDFKVSYRGLLTNETVESYKQQYPQYEQIFNRLYDNYRIIPCSSLFRYNLTQLLLVLLNKLDSTAIENFRQQIDIDNLNHLSLDDAKKLCNVRIFDLRKKRIMFDLQKGIFSGITERRLLPKLGKSFK